MNRLLIMTLGTLCLGGAIAYASPTQMPYARGERVTGPVADVTTMEQRRGPAYYVEPSVATPFATFSTTVSDRMLAPQRASDAYPRYAGTMPTLYGSIVNRMMFWDGSELGMYRLGEQPELVAPGVDASYGGALVEDSYFAVSRTIVETSESAFLATQAGKTGADWDSAPEQTGTLLMRQS